MKCRVCNNRSTITAGQNKWRKFCYCDRCGLVFVPEQYWISVEEEKKDTNSTITLRKMRVM